VVPMKKRESLYPKTHHKSVMQKSCTTMECKLISIRRRRLPAFLRPAPYRRFQPPLAHFEPGMLPCKVCASQLRWSRLQHRVSSDFDGGIEVSVHELVACIDAGGAQQCRGSSSSQPLCNDNLVIVPWDKHLFWHIAPLQLLHLRFFA
jgi:hypothetical protein